MSEAFKNITIATGGVSQDALPARLGRSFLQVDPVTEDCWLAFGSTAAVDNGALIKFGDEPRRFTVQDTPDIGGRVSIFSATGAVKINLREA